MSNDHSENCRIMLYLIDASAVAYEEMVCHVWPQLDMPCPALEHHAGLGHMHRPAHMVVSEGGRHEGHRICSVDDPQGGADQGMEGPLKLVVSHTRAAKGDTPHIGRGVLNCCPCCSCKISTHVSTSEPATARHHVVKRSTLACQGG